MPIKKNKLLGNKSIRKSGTIKINKCPPGKWCIDLEIIVTILLAIIIGG